MPQLTRLALPNAAAPPRHGISDVAAGVVDAGDAGDAGGAVMAERAGLEDLRPVPDLHDVGRELLHQE
ncbi:MAG TPA: hypothetical protein VFP72_08220 [Kineosporiaceae bacterium]|nr:hypothetical protein [Kineosporiaceae bacterium]